MFLALKEMQHAKLRFAMIGAIIALIAWLVLMLSGLGNGLGMLSAGTMKKMDVTYVVYEKETGASFAKSSVAGAIKEDLLQVNGVEKASLFGQASATIVKAGQKTDVAILGIESGSFVEPSVVEGHSLSNAVEKAVLADQSLQTQGYKLGDTVQVDSSLATFTIVGFVENETFGHRPALFTTLENWRAFRYAAPGSTNGLDDIVNAVFLQGKTIDPIQVEQAVADIEVVSKWKAVFGMPGYKEEMATIYMMLGFLVVIAAVVVSVFFYVFTIQKTQQFGIMKAMGATDAFIAKTVMAQVAMLTAMGVVVGLLLTVLTAWVLPDAVPFDLKIGTSLLYAGVLLVVSVLGSLLSVRRITKVDPLTALGGGEG